MSWTGLKQGVNVKCGSYAGSGRFGLTKQGFPAICNRASGCYAAPERADAMGLPAHALPAGDGLAATGSCIMCRRRT